MDPEVSMLYWSDASVHFDHNACLADLSVYRSEFGPSAVTIFNPWSYQTRLLLAAMFAGLHRAHSSSSERQTSAEVIRTEGYLAHHGASRQEIQTRLCMRTNSGGSPDHYLYGGQRFCHFGSSHMFCSSILSLV